MARPVLVLAWLLAAGGCSWNFPPLDRATDDAPSTVDAAAADAPVADAPVDASAIDAQATDAPATDAPVDAWDVVPPDVPSTLRVGHVNLSLPPAGFTSGAAWIHALYDARHPVMTNSVEVDWLWIWEVSPMSSSPLVGETAGLNSGIDWMLSGLRVPWLGSPVTLEPNRAADVFSVVPGDDTSRVLLFGGMRIGSAAFPLPIPPSATHCRVRARVRLTGPVLVQVGMDYWRQPEGGDPGTDRVLAGVSDWHVATGQWETIELDLVP